MKRIMLFTLLVFCAAMMVSAQGMNRRSPGDRRDGVSPRGASAEAVKVTGNLTLVRGMIAVKSEDVTYMVPGLIRYAGFIDSLKEGSQVTIEGSAAGRQEDSKTKILVASKMTIAGKEYDLSMPRTARHAWQGQGKNGQPRDRQFQHRQDHGHQSQSHYPRGRRR